MTEGVVPPTATQRMISWLINFIIYLRVHIICYLPQVVHFIIYLHTQKILSILRGQIANNVHMQVTVGK